MFIIHSVSSTQICHMTAWNSSWFHDKSQILSMAPNDPWPGLWFCGFFSGIIKIPVLWCSLTQYLCFCCSSGGYGKIKDSHSCNHSNFIYTDCKISIGGCSAQEDENHFHLKCIIQAPMWKVAILVAKRGHHLVYHLESFRSLIYPLGYWVEMSPGKLLGKYLNNTHSF